MGKPYASNKAAAELAETPIETIEWEGNTYDLCWKGSNVLVYSHDDGETADRMAADFGTAAKHSENRHDPVHWKTFSLVRLPRA